MHALGFPTHAAARPAAAARPLRARGGAASAAAPLAARAAAALQPILGSRRGARAERRRGQSARADGNGGSNDGAGGQGSNGDCGVGSAAPDGYVRACVDSVLQNSEQGPVIMLRVLDGTEYMLPVFIGENECNSLLNGMKKRPQFRPLTHDLMKTCFETLDFTIARVQVTHLRDGTYYARIVFTKKNAVGAVEERDVDARPSDAINMAVRFGAPIYINRVVVAASAYAINAAGAAIKVDEVPKKQTKKLDSALPMRLLLSIAVLENRLDDAELLSRSIADVAGGDTQSASLILEMEKAVKEERYMEAAALRDKLAALNPEVAE